MSPLARKLAAELIGTALLVATVIGSGIMATELTDDVAVQLLANSLVTGGVLVALILTLQPVSAAFNPVVTVAEAVQGDLPWRHVGPYVAAQVAGGALGAVVANLMFELDAVALATRERSGSGLWIGEVVATFGLVLVVFGGIRSGRTETLAFAVAGYIVAGYWFTSSTSFANPAVTLARTLSDTFAGIAPSCVLLFVLMQLVGGALGLGAVRLLWSHEAPIPTPSQESR